MYMDCEFFFPFWCVFSIFKVKNSHAKEKRGIARETKKLRKKKLIQVKNQQAMKKEDKGNFTAAKEK